MRLASVLCCSVLFCAALCCAALCCAALQCAMPAATACSRYIQLLVTEVLANNKDNCRLYLDRIKTSCRLLLRIANGINGRAALSYWLGSCAVPLFIQLYPKDSDGAEKKVSNLKLLAQHLQV